MKFSFANLFLIGYFFLAASGAFAGELHKPHHKTHVKRHYIGDICMCFDTKKKGVAKSCECHPFYEYESK